ncbi:sensor histidine kinase [Nocardioides sp.]|uniref:sensor histidine kinase n=1 Tax=Nocardioides sp. TaxID=35761 RepID=UPI003513CFF9
MTPPQRASRISVAARVFVVVALGAPVVWYRDQYTLTALVILDAIWLAISLAERRPAWTMSLGLAEAGAVGLLCGVALSDAPAVLLALVVAPFAAAVRHGVRAGALALGVQTMILLAAAFGASDQAPTSEQGLSMVTWTIASIGLALIGGFVHVSLDAVPDELSPYLDAQRLIRQLLDLSDDLSSGLDVPTLAGELTSQVRDVLPAATLGVYAPRGEVLVPLLARAHDGVPGADGVLEAAEAAEDLALESWTRQEPLTYHDAFAFPLGERIVVGGTIGTGSDLSLEEIEHRILDLLEDLPALAVQLETALLFADFRDSASADVRQRLAREMHDGVAQDIASLGYFVDALAAKATSETQEKAFALLRERITKIVAEVRQSVLTLRTSIGESASLGAAISTVARHLSESSRIPIAVTLDEHSTRLRAEVEAELFRIAQEAMNNAIKHSRCSAIEVHCQVHAPRAVITVTDDGRGLQQARSDSHGLKIMRERARLVGGVLEIRDNPTGGLTVAVTVGT